MKRFKYYMLGLGGAFLLSGLTGCSDFLDARNLSNAEDADVYFPEHPDQIRPVVYDKVRYIATHIDMLDQAGDLFINPRSADDGTFSMFTVTPDNSTVKSYYQNVMYMINRANCLIHYAGDNAQLAAEGRFIRVLGFYYLTQQFGSVPYVTEYVQTAQNEFPRTPLEECYANMLAECEDLYNNSPLEQQSHTGVASKQAVAAIAAKIALAAGWDLDTSLVNAAAGTYTVNDTKYFKKAVEWADKAIMGIQLTMPFAEKWAWNNEGNEEEIFSAQYDKDGYPGNKATNGHSLMNNYMAYYSNCVQTGQKGTGGGGTNCCSQKAASLFEKGDTRFEGTFMTFFYNAPINPETKNAEWGTQGYMAWYNCTPEEQHDLPIAMRIYPPATTVAEAEADIRQMIADGRILKKFANNTYGVNEPFAAIITGETVTKWEFNSNGTMPSKKTVPYTDFIRESANNGTCVTKYDDPRSEAVTGNQDYRDVPILHVSEMYLVAAEAYLLAGDQANSLKYINAVRKRAGASELASFGAYEAPYVTSANFTFVPLDLILDERARECYAERTRYFDLRRTKQLVRYNLEFSRFIKNVSAMSNAAGEIKWYRPIPQDEIDSNKAISSADQNPGY
ncbi:MAG: RagB/SusD family nutrient uptake outer membrane protein [Muribaculaceae bacterium]|nr:RagB/SusD family nutrient uptake outer membrane protein [Muribaculaceae bacterium]